MPERETIVAKTHMPYALGPARMAKYRSWFLDADYTVAALPSYARRGRRPIPSSPFSDLPVDSRYRFMLDEAQFFIMNFIKGPVCRGQIALDVIEDRFWVFFVDPEAGDDAIGRRTARARRRPTCACPPNGAATRSLLDPVARILEARSEATCEAKSEWLDRRYAVAAQDRSLD